MIERKDILSLEYYNHLPFTGSWRGMNYLIKKDTPEGGDPSLKATVFPGPYSSEHTDEALKTSHTFPFSEEGMIELTSWLNNSYQERLADWPEISSSM